ncbi:MAG: DMT family transporter [Pseudomonadota bacterium]
MPFAYLLAASLIGAAFAAQPAINSLAAKTLGSAFPATVLSVGITLAVSALIMLFGRTTPSLETFAQLPWWIMLGGLIGVGVVGGGAIIVPVTGVAIFFVCMIFGQMVGSVFLDQIGAFGLPVREISLMRLGGVVLTFAGVILVRYG